MNRRRLIWRKRRNIKLDRPLVFYTGSGQEMKIKFMKGDRLQSSWGSRADLESPLPRQNWRHCANSSTYSTYFRPGSLPGQSGKESLADIHMAPRRHPDGTFNRYDPFLSFLQGVKIPKGTSALSFHKRTMYFPSENALTLGSMVMLYEHSIRAGRNHLERSLA